MSEWEKILGGYATGTLTEAEHASLMQAALRDQALFETLLDEDALRETLADPATRAALLRALEPAAPARAWWRYPWPWAGLGAAAAALALLFIVRPLDEPKPVQVARNRPVAAAPEPVPAVIPTPRELRLSEPETKAGPPASARQAEPDLAAAPASPAQSVAPQEAVSAPMNVQAPAMMAKSAAAPAADPLDVVLSYQSEDGAWHRLDLGSAVPARRPLRLRVTSPQDGQLVLQPSAGEPLALVAGVPVDLPLPAQPAGIFRLRLTVAPPAGQELGRVASEFHEGKARATADSVVARPGRYSREIRLRIE